MSRFDDEGWDEDFPNQGELYARAQALALSGRRGQATLRELEAALLAMPKKRLIKDFLCKDGDVCALGALAVKKKMDRGVSRDVALDELDGRGEVSSETCDYAKAEMGLCGALATAIAYENDEGVMNWRATPEQRYELMLAWVRKQLEVKSPNGKSKT